MEIRSMKRCVAVLLLLLCRQPAFAQDQVVVPGANLVVDGVPAIPTSIADQVARYTDFRSATLFDWHPVKREMLIGTRFGDTNQIHLVRFPGGARSQLTFFADSATGATYKPGKG